MGERFHHARVADPQLLQELTLAAGEAVSRRDPAPLEAFLARHGGQRDPEWDGDLVARGLERCIVPGWEQDVGLHEHFVGWDAFVFGESLVPMGEATDDPPDDLLARSLERFGAYSAHQGLELLLEDWLRFAASFGHYVPPGWGTGDALREAAQLCTNAATEPNEDGEYPSEDERAALLRYRDTLRRVADAGHAVVEWVTKT